MTTSDTDLAYAAGVIDSDGCIAVRRSDYAARVLKNSSQAVYQPRITVKQVTPQAVDLLHELFGGYRFTGKAYAEKGRPLLGWDIHSAGAVAALERLVPYLRIKKAQALNAIEVGQINASPRRRGWDLPAVDPSEPLVPLLEAARRAGRSPDVAYQSAHLGNIPTLRIGRRVMVPESYVETWASRGASAPRRSELSVRLEALYQRAKELNRVGV